MNQIIF